MAALLSLLALLLALAGCGEIGNAPGADRAGAEGHRVPLPAASRRPPLPPILGSSDPERPLVVIDPGHGGRDPGAIARLSATRSAAGASDIAEKDVTLAIAKAVRDQLAASGRVRVALTRSSDVHLPLDQRVEIARRLGADLFISLHADAAGREGARGASLYTLSEIASDREAAQLARRENGGLLAGAGGFAGGSGGPAKGSAENSPTDLGPGRSESAVARILIDLAQREAMARSADFARLLHREAAPSVRFRPDHHRFAALAVLKAPDIPSVLFETGYLTNGEDLDFLVSGEGRERIAGAVRRAVETHFARRSRSASPGS